MFRSTNRFVLKKKLSYWDIKLIYACECYNPIEIKTYIKYGANVNSITDSSFKNDKSVIESSFRYDKANITTGYTPLHYLVENHCINHRPGYESCGDFYIRNGFRIYNDHQYCLDMMKLLLKRVPI